MEIDVFLALTSAGVSEAQARSAAEAIRKDMAAEIREAQKEVATKFDISNIKVDIANLKVEMANMKAEDTRLTNASRDEVARKKQERSPLAPTP